MRALAGPILMLALASACGSPDSVPMKADLSGTSLTLGPGRLPGGGEVQPPSGFQPTVSGLMSLVPAYKSKDIPDLKIWSVPIENQQAFARGARPDDPAVGGRPLRIIGQSFMGEGVLMQFEALWEGPADGRFLVVELWRNGRRLAVAASGIEIHDLPSTRPRDRGGD